MARQLRRRLTFANVCSFIALVVALGTGGAYAANTIGSDDIIDESIQSVDLKNGEVKTADLGANAVGASKVANESLTLSDIAGAASNGAISLSGIPNGRCSQVTFGVGGAQVGDSPIVTTRAAIQNGIVLYPNRVASAGHVEVNACNFTGTSMTPISNFPVRDHHASLATRGLKNDRSVNLSTASTARSLTPVGRNDGVASALRESILSAQPVPLRT